MSEIKVSQGCGPSGGSKGGSFLPLPASGPCHPAPPPASLGLWLPPSSLCCHVASPLCLLSSVSYKDTCH